MELTENYPHSRIILSSRPDDRFASWTTFHVASVSDLHKEDVLELIRKADFEIDAKERLSKSVVKPEFYNKHRSFLVNPLLASMMLLAFSRQYDIPDKMHKFYELAFQALYERHDSYKPGGYKREFKCEIGEGDFRRLLSYFCLVSYYEQAFSFSRPQILGHIDNAKKIMSVDHDSALFLHDLVHAVCLIVPEGTDFAFAHRSFQEYFAAYCMAYVTASNFDKFIEMFSKRPNDQVVKLIADMAPEKLRDAYMIPKSAQFRLQLKKPTGLKSVVDYFRNTNSSFIIRTSPRGDDKRRIPHIELHQSGEFNDFVKLCSSLNNFQMPPALVGPDKRDRDVLDVEAISMALRLKEGELVEISAGNDGRFTISSSDTDREWTERQLERAHKSFEDSRMFEFMILQLRSAVEYTQSAVRQGKGSERAMVEIFDFG